MCGIHNGARYTPQYFRCVLDASFMPLLVVGRLYGYPCKHSYSIVLLRSGRMDTGIPLAIHHRHA